MKMVERKNTMVLYKECSAVMLHLPISVLLKWHTPGDINLKSKVLPLSPFSKEQLELYHSNLSHSSLYEADKLLDISQSFFLFKLHPSSNSHWLFWLKMTA